MLVLLPGRLRRPGGRRGAWIRSSTWTDLRTRRYRIFRHLAGRCCDPAAAGRDCSL